MLQLVMLYTTPIFLLIVETMNLTSIFSYIEIKLFAVWNKVAIDQFYSMIFRFHLQCLFAFVFCFYKFNRYQGEEKVLKNKIASHWLVCIKKSKRRTQRGIVNEALIFLLLSSSTRPLLKTLKNNTITRRT